MRKRFARSLPFLAALVGMALLSTASPARADLAFTLSGDGTVTTTGNVSLPLLGLTNGTVTVNGTAIGETGLGIPASMDLSTITVTSTGPTTATLIFSMNNIQSPVGPGTITESITGSFAGGTGTISYTTYGSQANTLYTSVPVVSPPTVTSTGTPVTSLVPPNNTSSGAFTAVNPYSLTEVLTINFTSAGSVNLSSDARADFTSAVPEPGSMAMTLLAMPLLGLGYRMFRRRGE